MSADGSVKRVYRFYSEGNRAHYFPVYITIPQYPCGSSGEMICKPAWIMRVGILGLMHQPTSKRKTQRINHGHQQQHGDDDGGGGLHLEK